MDPREHEGFLCEELRSREKEVLTGAVNSGRQLSGCSPSTVEEEKCLECVFGGEGGRNFLGGRMSAKGSYQPWWESSKVTSETGGQYKCPSDGLKRYDGVAEDKSNPPNPVVSPHKYALTVRIQ